jgi:hypothetical protein
MHGAELSDISVQASAGSSDESMQGADTNGDGMGDRASAVGIAHGPDATGAPMSVSADAEDAGGSRFVPERDASTGLDCKSHMWLVFQ